MPAEPGLKAEFCRLFFAHVFGALLADVARTLKNAVALLQEISSSLSVYIVRMRKDLKIYAGNAVNNTRTNVQI